MNCRPVGIFDSGLGGLTVVKAVMERLPSESIVYFGDTARVPYGTKSREAVVQFSKENVAKLLEFNVKAVVIACNTASSWALTTLQQSVDIPVMGVIKPGALKANELTLNHRIGVIATPSTVRSHKYVDELMSINRRVQVFQKACPLFVPLVEEGWFDHPITQSIAEEYLQSLIQNDIDTCVLGCTHYPLIKDVIARTFGSSVRLVDSAFEVALQLEKLLRSMSLLNREVGSAQHKFIVSDEPLQFCTSARKFMGDAVTQVIHSADLNKVIKTIG